MGWIPGGLDIKEKIGDLLFTKDLALMTLTHDYDNIFTCGASVAPVVDWTLYDTYYTERYMGLNTKDDNLDGYQRASALTDVTNLKNKRYFLLHGTHDDNVHYQNSM